jgi:hypothetical protein
LKNQQAQTFTELNAHTLWPHHAVLKKIFGKLTTSDKNNYFQHPVSRELAPDYFDVIKRPMCWQTIEDKLERHQYWDTQVFRTDILLVLENALVYNKSDSPVYKSAHRLKTSALVMFKELDAHITNHPAAAVNTDENGSVDLFDLPLPLGDLEPPLEVLNLNADPSLVDDVLNIRLNDTPYNSLLAYEHAVFKPPPTPPPPPPPRPRKVKPKRDYEAERARAANNRRNRNTKGGSEGANVDANEAEGKEGQEGQEGDEPRKQEGEEEDARQKTIMEVEAAAAAADLDTSPGFRGRRATRGSGGDVSVIAERSVSAAAVTSQIRNATAGPSQGVRRPRPNAPPTVERAAVPLIADDVDKRQSFSHFESGWILPEGSRRSAAKVRAIDSPVRPPPKKKARLGEFFLEVAVRTVNAHTDWLRINRVTKDHRTAPEHGSVQRPCGFERCTTGGAS